jgi:hypothetical protein
MRKLHGVKLVKDRPGEPELNLSGFKVRPDAPKFQKVTGLESPSPVGKSVI